MKATTNKTDAPQLAQYKPLTKWTNEPSVTDLKTDVESAKQSHDALVQKIDRWTDQLEIKNRAKPPATKNRSQVQPKLIRRQAEWRYSALSEPFLGTNKLFSIRPATFEDKLAAEQNELLLNWQFRTKLNKVKFIDEYVRATVDEGTCVVRVSWKRITEPSKEFVPIWHLFPIDAMNNPEEMQALQSAMDLYDENPRGYEETVPDALKEAVEFYLENEQTMIAIQNGEEEVETETVLQNEPCLEIMNPRNVIIDPSCNGDIDKAMFAVYTFETSLSELKKEPKRYKNLDKVNWEGNTPMTQPDHDSKTPDEFGFRDKARKKVVAYEYWGFYDISGKDKLEPIVATWIGDVMIRMERNPFPDKKLPFVVVPYLPRKREVHGETDAELLEDNQAILGAITRGMIDSMGKSANGQMGFAKGMLDPLNRRRFNNGEDYEFNPNQPPAQGLIEHKFPELPQSSIIMLQLQNQDAEALTGVKSFSGGLSGSAYGDVATGIRGVLDAASKREMSILRRLAVGIVSIGNKITAMNAEFLSEKEIVRVTNEKFVTVNREDLAGNFDLIVDIATAEVDDAKAKDLGFMLQTLGPNMDPEITMEMLAEIATLKQMPVLANRLRNWKPKPDPMKEMLAQLEIENKRLENMKIQSEIDKNRAQAAMYAAQKDKADLDFVEQETGTTHARAKDLQGAQAQANQALEVTKALTKPRKAEEKAPDLAAAFGFNQLSANMNAAV